MKPLCSALFFSGLATLVFACANPSENAHAQHPNTTITEAPAATADSEAPHAHATETPEIKLNNGQPWDANRETTKGIVLMSDLAFRFTERDDPQAYANLQKELKQEFGQIIEKCTMKGEAHNQLHHYLVPLQRYIDGLTASELATAASNLDQLKTHLAAYSTYFQTR